MTSILSKRIPNILCLVAVLFFYFIWKSDFFPSYIKESAVNIWLVLVLCIFCVVSRTKWICTVFTLILLVAIWVIANRIKINALAFPITTQDIMITAVNLKHFFYAIGMSRGMQITLLILTSITLAAITTYIVVKHRTKISNYIKLKNSLPFCTMFLSAAFIFQSFYYDYGKYIYDNINTILNGYVRKRQLIYATTLCHLSGSKLLLLGFLSYSSYALKYDRYQVKSNQSSDQPITEDNVKKIIADSSSAILKNKLQPNLMPNIVFMFAESTFDLNSVLLLNKKVNNSLFNPGADRLGGLLHVTPFGGSSWRTEFETVTGLDSRLFGFLGQYTHSSLSPHIKNSFVTHLKEKYGYFTEVFYPVSGKFFSAGFGYKNCGFDSFRDGPELGFKDRDWSKFSDEMMADVVVREMRTDLSTPFFNYVVLLENHGPHTCKNFTHENQLKVKFASDNSFEGNCELNEYVKRVQSAEVAYKKILGKLKDIEEKTGRPFIIVIFGDHQIDFRGTTDKKNRNQEISSPYYTFYLIEASKSIKLPKVTKTFHASFIPTLISAIIAKDLDDIYLPENLYVFNKCGDTADLQECDNSLSPLLHSYKKYIRLY